jgi:hypothetical protein
VSKSGIKLQFCNTDPSKVIVVERKRDGEQPEYCVHGETRCVGCNAWCWLGNNSLKQIVEGDSTPWCQQCAAEKLQLDEHLQYGMVVDERHG